MQEIMFPNNTNTLFLLLLASITNRDGETQNVLLPQTAFWLVTPGGRSEGGWREELQQVR